MIKIFFIALILTALAPMELYAWNPLEAKRPGTRTAAAPAAENAATDGLAVFDIFIEAAAAGEIEKMWQLFAPEMRLWIIINQGSEKQALENFKEDSAPSSFSQTLEGFNDPAKKQTIRNNVSKKFLPVKCNNQWYIIANKPNAKDFFPQPDQTDKKKLCLEVIRCMRDQDVLTFWLLMSEPDRKEYIKKNGNEAQALIAFEKDFSNIINHLIKNDANIQTISSTIGMNPEETFIVVLNLVLHTARGNFQLAFNTLPHKFKQQAIKFQGSEEAAVKYLKNNADTIYLEIEKAFAESLVLINGKCYIKM